ncbi:MAG: UDP-N-acetylglucosamine 2-epimerase [Candidatus Cloacimonetes bacterium]|nr:UDP-N-acetylglucosamine 2-epimerase [Candidatus Cloacimonadota bacterium]
MKKIAIFSTSRADFGLFEALLRECERVKYSYYLFLGGMHTKEEFGKSINDAKKFEITETFDFLLNEDTSKSKSKSLGIESFALSEIFSKYSFDFVLILGDRFELLPIVNTAIIFKKTIVHLHGGEITEGAIDEQIRHMITKSAHLHFTACEDYSNNIKKMGEENWRVHNVGALGLDNILNVSKIKKEELFKELSLDSNQSVSLCTYHPVTLEYKLSPEKQVQNLFKALENYSGQIVLTAPNIDPSYSTLLKSIKKEIEKNKNISYHKHLGIKKYLSLIKYCDFVIGNSSSGILEVPYFKIPTINIGDRQKGRIRHKSIIDTDYSVESIKIEIGKALDSKFRSSLENMKYKFGDGHAAERIINVLKNTEIYEKLMRKKLNFSGV